MASTVRITFPAQIAHLVELVTIGAFSVDQPLEPFSLVNTSRPKATMSLLRVAAAPRALPRLALAARYASSAAAPSSSQPLTVTHSTNNASGALLGNIEATWKSLSPAEQSEVYQKLEQVQKKDWKELTVDEKKAGECRRWGEMGAVGRVAGGIRSMRADEIRSQTAWISGLPGCMPARLQAPSPYLATSRRRSRIRTNHAFTSQPTTLHTARMARAPPS